MRVGVTGVVGVALAVACVSTAAAQSQGVGPFRLGMSYDEARAAAPGVAWTEVRSEHTGKVIALKGAQGVQVGGATYDVEIFSRAYDAYEIVLERQERKGGFSGCQRGMVELVAALEGRFGAFGPLADKAGGERHARGAVFTDTVERRLPGKLVLGWASADVVRAGAASSVDVVRGPSGRGSLHAVRGPDGDRITVTVGAGYSANLDAGEPPCLVFASISYWPERPEFETVAFEGLKPLSSPTIAAKHYSLDLVSELPPGGIDVRLDCELDRATGQLRPCFAVDKDLPPTVRSAAAKQAEAVRVDPTALDPDRDVPLRTQMVVRLDPSDRKTASLPPEVVPLLWNQVRWAWAPRREYLSSLISSTDAEGSVSAVCEIQSDGSLICGDPVTQPLDPNAHGTDHSGLARVGKSAIAAYRAAPTLPDGTPSTGRWVTFKLNAKLER